MFSLKQSKSYNLLFTSFDVFLNQSCNTSIVEFPLEISEKLPNGHQKLLTPFLLGGEMWSPVRIHWVVSPLKRKEKEKKKEMKGNVAFLVCFFSWLFCNYQTQVRYWYPALNFRMKFSRRQLGWKILLHEIHKGPYYTVYVMLLWLGVCLRDLDFKSNLEQLIHLHIQVIYEYAE